MNILTYHRLPLELVVAEARNTKGVATIGRRENNTASKDYCYLKACLQTGYMYTSYLYDGYNLFKLGSVKSNQWREVDVTRDLVNDVDDVAAKNH